MNTGIARATVKWPLRVGKKMWHFNSTKRKFSADDIRYTGVVRRGTNLLLICTVIIAAFVMVSFAAMNQAHANALVTGSGKNLATALQDDNTAKPVGFAVIHNRDNPVKTGLGAAVDGNQMSEVDPLPLPYTPAFFSHDTPVFSKKHGFVMLALFLMLYGMTTITAGMWREIGRSSKTMKSRPAFQKDHIRH